MRTQAEFDSDHNLCYGDMCDQGLYITLRLKQSKTDPFRKGMLIQLHPTGKAVCPVKSLRQYLALRPSSRNNPNDPLFLDESGAPLTRGYFIKLFTRLLDLNGLDSTLYKGHSFRIGAATEAGKARIEDHLIQTLGRWPSPDPSREACTNS